MDGDYVASLLMGAPSCAAQGLDFAAPALDGGFLEGLCGAGGAGFAERAARVSGGGAYRAAPGSCERGGSREGSSVSDPAWAHAWDGNARKRRVPAGAGAEKGKEATCFSGGPCKVAGEANGPDSKKCKGAEAPVVPKSEEGQEAASDGSVGDRGQKQSRKKNPKPAAEPPKDYVHVRARRGEATDSHSLAERVRREKISQRMKFLQDLVPGCNKVVGKALMLDEIINYVQSLQQQVEFLSMKLATVNPQLDFSNLSTLLHKDMYQACGPSVSSIFPLESAGTAFPFCEQADFFQSFSSGPMDSLGPLETALPHTTNTQYTFLKQQRDFWEQDIENDLHIDNEQSQENEVSAAHFDGQSQPEDHTKIEF